MTVTKPIVSLAAVRAHLPVRSGNEELNEKLTQLIIVATNQIESLTRRSFTLQEHTQYLNSADTQVVTFDLFGWENESGLLYDARSQPYTLKGVPVDTAEDFSVYYDRTRVFAADTLVDPTAYYLNAATSTLTTQFGMKAQPGALKVVYTAGYAVDTETDSLNVAAPADLRMACTLQVLHMWNRFTPDNLGFNMDRNQSKGGYGQERRWLNANGLTPEVAGLVAHYRPTMIGLA